MKTLVKKQHSLASSEFQLMLLSKSGELNFPTFLEKSIKKTQPATIEVFQISMGKMCNQVCSHCHVDAGPDRREIMTKETMKQCLNAIEKTQTVTTVDLTGGAPEMNPNFNWFVEQLVQLGIEIIVRCNLTIILANPKYYYLPEFFKKHKIRVVSSLPYFTKKRTDSQRGEGVFEKSIKALQMLNDVGYGLDKSSLKLDLVYNPAGAFMVQNSASLEKQFKERLLKKYHVQFNNLLTITNLPVSRFLEYLINTNQYEDYMNELIERFNPDNLKGLMCKSYINVGWNGSLYDCDFNQMLDLEIHQCSHLKDYDVNKLLKRTIRTNRHCFGCTAGGGSGCGGSIS